MSNVNNDVSKDPPIYTYGRQLKLFLDLQRLLETYIKRVLFVPFAYYARIF